MIRLTGENILALLNRETPGWAKASRLDWTADGISTDTRTIHLGDLFVPLKGERFDGHAYVAQAAESGAVAVLTERDDVPCENRILVPDTREALQRLAKSYRMLFHPLVVALTGSVGKTTTKEMTAAVFGSHFKTMKTNGNFNNDIGVPLTLLCLTPEDEAAVVEMGMSHLGEIRVLTHLAQPDIAIITNIGTSHIGNLGSQEMICQAKLEILEGLRAGGTVVLNGDDPFLSAVSVPDQFRRCTFGIENPDTDVSAENIRLTADGSAFDIAFAGERYPAEIRLAGRHNIANALAAFAAGVTGGVPPQKAAAALAGVEPEGMRQRLLTLGGCTVIEDCYNANPDSMRAALRVLREYKGRHVALLGDMLELGDFSKAEHRRIGEAAAASADLLVAVGAFAKDVAEGAQTGGMKTVYTPERAEAAALLKTLLRPGDVLLVKGSRGMRMEEILHDIFENA